MLQLLLRRCGIKGTKPTVSKPAAAGELAQGELWLNNNHETPGLFARADDDTLIEFAPYSKVVAKAGDTMTGNLTVPSLNNGQMAGLRNILINGDLKLNQRGVTIAAAAVGAYGPDRWKRTAGGMTQVIESGGFAHGVKYTLSGTGVTTQVLTAPASGDWTIPDVPITATNIQLERGEVATAFEVRPVQLEAAMCMRYFQGTWLSGTAGKYPLHPDGYLLMSAPFPPMRTGPTVKGAGPGHAEIITGTSAAVAGSVATFDSLMPSRVTPYGVTIVFTLQVGIASLGTIWAASIPVQLDAEL